MSKIALITGSNKGIGYGIAKALLESAPEFSTIILTSRSPELGEAARNSLGHLDRTVYHKLDVQSAQEIHEVAEFVRSTYGQIDVLINNAGWAAKGDDFNVEIVRTTIGINFYGVKNLTEAFIPLLKPNGHIVIVSSWLGNTEYLSNPQLAEKFLSPDLTLTQLIDLAEEFTRYVGEGTWEAHGWPTFGYGVSKNLVSAYTRVLNREFVKNGTKLRVNAVNPGWVKTDMAGDEAELTIEQGAATPVLVARDESEISGKYWSNQQCLEFS